MIETGSFGDNFQHAAGRVMTFDNTRNTAQFHHKSGSVPETQPQIQFRFAKLVFVS